MENRTLDEIRAESKVLRTILEDLGRLAFLYRQQVAFNDIYEKRILDDMKKHLEKGLAF